MFERLAPAKINLGLHVLRRRTDGYHDIETVLLRIPWTDRLSVAPGEALTLACSDPALPTDENNLCLKAARRLAEQFGVRHGAAIRLEKRIPYGAGLGGGSSDAAATLQLLDALWNLGATDRQLHALAAAVGSDVPFFLGPPAAYAEGRGERLAPLHQPDEQEPYSLPYALVVVVPPVEVSTAEAYRRVRPRATDRPDLPALVRSNDLARWRRDLVNDFEEPLFGAFPAIRAVKETLLDAGAGYAAVSGSGSAVFGVFEEDAGATAAAEAARRSGHRVWHGML